MLSRRSVLLGGLRDFPEALDPAHPLYAFRSIPSMANAALQDNGCTVRFAYGGAAIGDPAAPQTIRDRIAAGVIRSGDVVVFEDAGSHGSDPAAYCAQWQALRAAAGDRHDITVVMMSMFDYLTNPELMPAYQYDVAIGGMTMNQATYAAARADLGCIGQTLWLDMNAKMDQWRNSALNGDGVNVIHPDGIHPNVWGQMLMVGEIMKAVGLRPYIADVPSAMALAQANYLALAYGGPNFTANRAREYAKHCLMR